jgi:hypothetical protein
MRLDRRTPYGTRETVEDALCFGGTQLRRPPCSGVCSTVRMDACPSTTKTACRQTSNLSIYYPAADERVSSQSQDGSAEAFTRGQHEARGQNLVLQVGDGDMWRHVRDWDASRGKGKGREVVCDDETVRGSSRTADGGKEGEVSSAQSHTGQSVSRSTQAPERRTCMPSRWIIYRRHISS